MTVNVRQVGGVTIVDLSGRLVLGDALSLLRDTVRGLVAQGKKDILLNLGDVPYIDSSGIGELVSIYTSVRRQHGDLKLMKLSPKVKDLLLVTKLYTIFDVKEDETVAVNAFRWAS